MAGFAFKQFCIEQENTAMKVSTDGILLGAWVNLSGVKSLLDIGAGTGLLSLMCKQRAECLAVTAVEIESGAFQDARLNIQNSRWLSDISLHQSAIQDFKSDVQFDLVISNPPYFNDSLKGPSAARNLARHTDSLSFSALLNEFKRLSHPLSRLAVVLPYKEGLEFIALAQQQDLHLVRKCEVKTTERKAISRLLLEFENAADSGLIEPENTVLSIHENGQYSKGFIALCRDFYLKM
jgi:tRNA1Val (adenine37-N6)-methyltransferase